MFMLFQYSYKYLIKICLDILHLLLYEQHLGKKLSVVPNGCYRLGEESSKIIAVSVLLLVFPICTASMSCYTSKSALK